MLADLARFMIDTWSKRSLILFFKSLLRVYYVTHTILNAGDRDRKGCNSTEAYIIE